MDTGNGFNSKTSIPSKFRKIVETMNSCEEIIHSEIDKYNAIINSTDSELELIRERRLENMKKVHNQRQQWRAMGHGTYIELGKGQYGGDVAREFFYLTKESNMVVVHFHRSSTRICDIFHSHLYKLALKHLETRFIKINVDKCSEYGVCDNGESYLVNKLGIVIMPTLAIINNRKVVHQIRGFDELGGTENFTTNSLECLIESYDGINQSEIEEKPDEIIQGNKIIED